MQMKIHYRNLNMRNERCKCRNNTKQQCSCVPTLYSSKMNGWLKWGENNVKCINLQGFHCLLHVHLRWETSNKTRKIRFSVKVDFFLRFFQTHQIFECKNIWIIKEKSLCCNPYSCTVSLQVNVQFYQRCEPMVLKMWVKCVLW